MDPYVVVCNRVDRLQKIQEKELGLEGEGRTCKPGGGEERCEISYLVKYGAVFVESLQLWLLIQDQPVFHQAALLRVSGLPKQRINKNKHKYKGKDERKMCWG